MERPRAVLLLLLGLLCLLEAGSGLPAQSGSLKRKKKKKGSSVELRLLNESQAGSGSSASGPDYLYLALRRYLNNQELTEWLQSYEKRCKSIARLTKIGTSAQDRPLWALEISDRPGQAEAEPAVKYVGGVHGDEPTGRVLTLALAEWLCANYKTDARAKRIISTMHLWLLPAMNPDGFDARSRGNSAGQDLNRDFPDRFSSPPMEPSGSEQPETKAIMDWTLATGFVASASMHEGALVANYPWDGTDDRSTRYEACPDDAVFRHLATLYASTHKHMASPDNAEFPNGGTTNGANWYPIYGSMQDWNYVVGHCLELTLELRWDGAGPGRERWM
ncbi:hypothetical protein CHLNCDRAFT_49638 [Chlorella variabilis]|uniref:Peptidase M14 domain-containing protein n=1 Tax=Chlorella variabilis TaxID=554065 RepID=E1Z388_CHLVA|nr:hypothetical protein CHLNCDRAFT_49638 [Chlorella variabilis]EFN60129.1 hypothetical protein CHLNCDRAFT_49638 [Chlorella variabilis]|eukprot:XP_005852231.1 hypothetical protein CHLNCDRAFT_49638 [Chlorella variabilis]